MSVKTQEIIMEAYNYPLPNERIAKFPLKKRDESKLLLYKEGKISESVFKNLPNYLPPHSLVVFNNTRVIRARLLFHKSTGAKIEVFCLEPLLPSEYAQCFQATERCEWSCLVGNSKKWKEGILSVQLTLGKDTVVLNAERLSTAADHHRIAFTWDNPAYTFSEVIEAAGVLPIPPYLHRDTQKSDLTTYQTVYSKVKGSVAAPTAGLHFTAEVLDDLKCNGFEREELTLHVGAGTFKPVKDNSISNHIMHTEHFSVKRQTIENVLNHLGSIIAVGTTSVRTLESLYYIGVKLAENPEATAEELTVPQWMPYSDQNNTLTPKQALQNIIDYIDRHHTDRIVSATQIIIVPGYNFKVVRGIVTNFHQPKSTLMLLVSAFVKGNWKPIYTYALSHDFRFLSYGDSSLLL